MNKQTELKFLPIKLKFYQNDLIFFYKIVNSLVPINLPEHFTFIDGEKLRYTRGTAQVIDKKDKTQILCCIKPSGESFIKCFFSIGQWNFVPFELRQEPRLSIFKAKLTRLLWNSDIDWPD